MVCPTIKALIKTGRSSDFPLLSRLPISLLIVAECCERTSNGITAAATVPDYAPDSLLKWILNNTQITSGRKGNVFRITAKKRCFLTLCGVLSVRKPGDTSSGKVETEIAGIVQAGSKILKIYLNRDTIPEG